MRVLLVNPPRFQGVPVIREERCEITERYSILPPYSLLQIASILRADKHSVELVDANGINLSSDQVNSIIQNSNFDVIIFRFTPTTYHWDMKIASFSKMAHPKAWTIGICWTLRTVPESVLSNAPDLDIYVMHDYEVVTPAVVSAISFGKNLSTVPGIAYRGGDRIQVNAMSKPIENWDSLPLPAYDLLPSIKNYFINTHHGAPFMIMYAGKGCPFSCIYCTERNTKVKNRSAERILRELKYIKEKFNIKTVSFFDETFTIDRERAIAIAEGINRENLKILWYCNTRVNLVDKSLLKIMYNGGCRGISFGIESGSQTILDNAQKGVTVKQAEDAINLTKEVGMKVYCSFIFGLPGENWNTVNETIKFVRRTLPTGAQFNVAVPYPGTELYQIALKKGWIKAGIDWSTMYQHESAMRTDELTSEELNKARKMGYRALYFNSRWWLQNLWHVFKEPDDFQLALRYSIKIINNYVFHKMVHAH
ncbi:MAG: radical SAM protein [Candidatus Bathyarchaeia archaeon]|jgi:radical SAM superfamily enzyme YgiQ (UPF0313 family)